MFFWKESTLFFIANYEVLNFGAIFEFRASRTHFLKGTAHANVPLV